MLADFDEIDKYLVDTNDIFGNIASLKKLDEQWLSIDEQTLNELKRFWHLFDAKQTNETEHFKKTWALLGKLYSGLNESMLAAGQGHTGLLPARQ
ncbi:MAG: hypothetical protein HC896_10375 [Bacteroidales bacterium]|nr:hypothetical protein [Bacteroidales bacterium]